MAESDAPRTTVPTVVPRGRHAPPLEVRLTVQRRRLFEAAADGVRPARLRRRERRGDRREAGMSKATFYEHFANKEEAILALFDEAATEVHAPDGAARPSAAAATYPEHLRRGTRAFLRTLAEWPDAAQTLLVEIIGAGPRATERRDAILEAFADAIYRDNAAHRAAATARRASPRATTRSPASARSSSSPRASCARASPGDIRELEPVIERLMLGILQQAA